MVLCLFMWVRVKRGGTSKGCGCLYFAFKWYHGQCSCVFVMWNIFLLLIHFCGTSECFDNSSADVSQHRLDKANGHIKFHYLVALLFDDPVCEFIQTKLIPLKVDDPLSHWHPPSWKKKAVKVSHCCRTFLSTLGWYIYFVGGLHDSFYV